MKVNNHVIDMIGIEFDGQVEPLPIDLSTFGDANKVKNLAQLAGIINKVLKTNIPTTKPVPTGGKMNFYNNNQLVGSVLWIQDPKHPDKRKTVTLFDSLFPVTPAGQKGRAQNSQDDAAAEPVDIGPETWDPNSV